MLSFNFYYFKEKYIKYLMPNATHPSGDKFVNYKPQVHTLDLLSVLLNESPLCLNSELRVSEQTVSLQR